VRTFSRPYKIKSPWDRPGLFITSSSCASR
jgi:hypothetical protein